MTTPVNTDPFADPIIPPSTFPTQASFRGRLVMITPRKIETVPNSLGGPGAMQDRVTADVSVVDGRGPVPQFKNNQPTGSFLDGPDFTGVWLTGTYLLDQIRAFVGTGRPVLGTIETKTPGQIPVKGNPWGIVAATPEQKAQAIAFLNSRAIGGAAAPDPQPQAQPVPAASATAPTYPMQATATPAPVYGAPATAPATPAPGSAGPSVNPFL